MRPKAHSHRLAWAMFIGMMGVFLLVGTWFARVRHPSRVTSTEFEEKQELPPPTWVVKPGGQCPVMEVDVEFEDLTSGFGMTYDHIPSPDLCCSLCQAEPRCQSWSWIKDAGLDGCPSQCWIKGALGNRLTDRWGRVSGVPPQKPPLGILPPGKGAPDNSLWCFSLMMPYGSETELILYQYQQHASIFACDGWAVFSNVSLTMAEGLVTKAIQSDLTCDYGGDSQTALNSWIFIALWDKICDDAEYRAYKWVVKVDPDCVFFPDRLLAIIPAYADAQYINNCKYGLHGPIEVFSMGAIDVLAAEYATTVDGRTPGRCVTEQRFGQWGEDMFIDQCLSKVLSIWNIPLEPRLVCEDKCGCEDFYWCSKGLDRVSYHPFKTVGAYDACLANAMMDQSPAAIPTELRFMAPTY